MVRDPAAQHRPVAHLVPPDTLRVGLEALAVPRHGGDGDGHVVGRAVPGGLEGETRVATGYAALVAGGQAAVAGDKAGGGRIEADVCYFWGKKKDEVVNE